MKQSGQIQIVSVCLCVKELVRSLPPVEPE